MVLAPPALPQTRELNLSIFGSGGGIRFARSGHPLNLLDKNISIAIIFVN
jgi:hypothetical protein